MTPEELKAEYGKEYPAAMIDENGVRQPLIRETRFWRAYGSGDLQHQISRFMDGSAAITATEVQEAWPAWTDNERVDFCQAAYFGGLTRQPDFPEMARFIMQHSGPRIWSSLALSVAVSLPQNEAFDLFRRMLPSTHIGHTAGIAQAIAHTKHPQAEALLRQYLDSVWANADLWKDDSFNNWVAHDAICCINYLIKLGASPVDFEEQVHQLSKHVCSGSRDSCRNHLGKHYSWLK